MERVIHVIYFFMSYIYMSNRKFQNHDSIKKYIDFKINKNLSHIASTQCCVSMGPPGLKGTKGDKGAIGEKGEKGATGANGTDGVDGEKGEKGAAGANGTDGVDGEKGEKGAAGANGIDGVDGEKGEKGATGANGIDGVDGEKGEKGAAGANGIDGVDGEKGEKGAAGANGIDGVDGEKGEKGAAGANGIDGVDGEKGEKGAAGPPGPSPLITKGDIYVFGDMGNTRQPVGPDGSLLRANSATVTGLDYVGDIDLITTNTLLGQNVKMTNNPTPITGIGNTGFGFNVMPQLIGGSNNTAIGTNNLFGNISGNNNTAVGSNTMTNTNGNDNTAVGNFSLSNNTTGVDNTAIGSITMQSNTTGGGNIAIGKNSLFNNVSGNDNIAIGTDALPSNITGNFNLCIGASAGIGLGSSDIGNIVIGNISGIPSTNTTFVANIFNTSVIGTPVYVDSDNRLGVNTSSKIYKENIIPLTSDVTNKISLLKPVSFTYKSDANKNPQYGLIAEDVYQVLPELVVMNDISTNTKNSENHSVGVKYEQIIPLLISEINGLKDQLSRVMNYLESQKINFSKC